MIVSASTSRQAKPAQRRAAKPLAQASITTAGKMTHAQLCDRARVWLAGSARCQFAFVEFSTQLIEIPDAIGLRNSGRDSILVECKASRADFLRDHKKRHRQADAKEALGSYRYYMCEPGVIEVADLPERWGLLWVYGKQVKVMAGADPKRSYYGTADVWRWPHSIAERVVMFSALRRLQIELGAATFRDLSQKTIAEKAAEHWTDVIGCARNASTSDARTALEAARIAARPENGGSAYQLQRVAMAWQQACLEYGISE